MGDDPNMIVARAGANLVSITCKVHVDQGALSPVVMLLAEKKQDRWLDGLVE
jgi:hypothetical protein